MDPYTRKTKAWLEERYRRCGADGVYFAHQPIYGFRKGSSEQGSIARYIHTFAIMSALSHIEFSTLLDAGAAEGYKAYVAKRLFHSRVTSSDISGEACRRAREIFGIASLPADIHALPFGDGRFDVALCSETLEHVTDVRRGVAELLRVARKAVVITVPHEPGHRIEKNVDEGGAHAHIHHFDIGSFDYLAQEGYRVIRRKVFSPILYFPSIIADASPIESYDRARYPESVVRAYNRVQPWLEKVFGAGTASFVIGADAPLCRLFPWYQSILAVVLKDGSCWKDRPATRVRPADVLGISVPLHRLRTGDR